MKLDMAKLDWSFKEHHAWAAVHDLVAHPLLALSGYARWARRFHYWTSNKAWPPATPRARLPMPRALVAPVFYRWRRNG